MKVFPYQDGDRLIELVERRELDAAQVEIARLTALIRRLHQAIFARMCADEPTGDERLELMHAWNAAALLVTPNAAECGQCADKAPTTCSNDLVCHHLGKCMADPAAEIRAMREAIREAHKIIQVLYMDALDNHKESWPRANEWMDKHAAFATQEP